MVIADQRLALSQGLEDLDRRFEDGAHVRPLLADEPSALTNLVDLDCGLIGDDGNTEVLVPASPLMGRLVLPDARQHQEPLQQDPSDVLEADGTTGYVSGHTTALVLILAMFFGATSAAFVFHERLSQTVVQWQTARK